MVAETLTSEKFRALSPAKFFARYREIAGFSNPTRALYQTVRELVENALDATDSHGILPNIKIVIRQSPTNPNHYIISVEDNGIGIPPQHVPNAFGRVLYSSKYVLRQTRGMYGLGVKAAIIYGQMTTGNPVEVVTSTRGSKRIYYFKLRIDLNKNEPIILERGSWRKVRDWHGTIASITIEGDWSRAKRYIIEYIRRTAVITPYANIVFVAPDGEIYYYKRSIDKLPLPPKEVKPHPRGVDLELLKELSRNTTKISVKDMLVNAFQGLGDKTAEEILRLSGIDPRKEPKKLTEKELTKLANVMRGIDLELIQRLRDSTKESKVVDMLVKGLVGLDKKTARRMLKEKNIDPDKDPKQLDEKELEEIVSALSKIYPRIRPPTAEALSPLGEDIIKAGLQRVFEPEFVEAVTRRPRAYQGHPFIIEVGIAYGGKVPVSYRYPILLRYANKIPLLYDEKSDVSWKVIERINWEHYKVSFPAPILVLTHVCSTKVPFKGVGKESVADVPEIERELRLALRDVLRKLRIYLSHKIKEMEKKRRIVILTRYVPEIARNLAIILRDSMGHDNVEPLLREKLVEAIASRIGLEKEKIFEIIANVEIGI